MFWTRLVERTAVLNVKKERLELSRGNSFSYTFFCFRDNSRLRAACVNYRAFCSTGMHVVVCALALSGVSTGMHVVVCAPALSGVFSTCTAAKQKRTELS